jgi:uroporphyrin-III C-methyltransferase/precorrin-2 dehydrogenase/sirohydrochlorin ferrochelatase
MNAIIDHRISPSGLRSGRMQKLARLPVFFALQGKRALVAGGSTGAAWKAELLSAAGAHVDVYAADASEELLAVAAAAPHGPITLHRRAWMPDDFVGGAMAIGACDSDDEAARFADAARASGVPLNVIDKPDFCDFAFGAIVNRSPLVIGISTDGAAPVFAQAIRGKIEALIPAGFAYWAEAARRWRDGVKQSGLSFAGRRRFWQLFTARAMAQPHEAPAQSDYKALLAQTVEEGTLPEHGSVTLIDVTPGQADLLTLRAARALQAADVVVFDKGVPDEALDFARREASKVPAAQLAGNAEQTIPWILSLVRSGKRVVCLRDLQTARDMNIHAFRSAGIPVAIVPGVAIRPDVGSDMSSATAA